MDEKPDGKKKNKREKKGRKKKATMDLLPYSNAFGRSVPCLGPVDKSNGESCQWTRLKSRTTTKSRKKGKFFACSELA